MKVLVADFEVSMKFRSARPKISTCNESQNYQLFYLGYHIPLIFFFLSVLITVI